MEKFSNKDSSKESYKSISHVLNESFDKNKKELVQNSISSDKILNLLKDSSLDVTNLKIEVVFHGLVATGNDMGQFEGIFDCVDIKISKENKVIYVNRFWGDYNYNEEKKEQAEKDSHNFNRQRNK